MRRSTHSDGVADSEHLCADPDVLDPGTAPRRALAWIRSSEVINALVKACLLALVSFGPIPRATTERRLDR